MLHTVDMEKMTTLQGLGEEVYKVTAIMFHPHDAAARRTFVASARVDMMHRLQDAKRLTGRVIMDIPPRDVSILHLDRLLDEAMPLALTFKGTKGKGEGYTGTAIAAMILARALTEADAGGEELGIAQVISDQGEALKEQGVVGAGRDKLTEIWHEYRASAHISLACLEMGSDHRLLEDPGALFRWIARSEDLFRAGSSIGNRFASPILPPGECWTIVMRPSLGG